MQLWGWGAARAGGPLAAAVYAAALGYDALLWSLVGLGLLAAALALRLDSGMRGSFTVE